MFRHLKGSPRRRAVAVVIIAAAITVLLGMAVLTIDVGYMYNVRAALQHTADAAAHAGAMQLPNKGTARAIARQIARTNYPNHGNILATSDIALGNWDPDVGVFTAGLEPTNAVKVLTRRSEQKRQSGQLVLCADLRHHNLGHYRKRDGVLWSRADRPRRPLSDRRRDVRH